MFEAGAARGPGHLMCPNCGMPMEHAAMLVTAYRDFFRACTAVKDTLGVSLLVKLEE